MSVLYCHHSEDKLVLHCRHQLLKGLSFRKSETCKPNWKQNLLVCCREWQLCRQISLKALMEAETRCVVQAAADEQITLTVL